MPGLRDTTVDGRRIAVVGYVFYAAMIALYFFADLASRPIGADEVLSLYQVSERSLSVFFGSFEAGVNALPYAYFVILWGIDQLLGLNPLTLRLPSAIFALASLILLHRFLAALFGNLRALVACCAALLLSSEFALYSHDARPYALYLLAAVLCLQCALAMLGTNLPTRRALAANALAAFFLPGVHYVGIFYSIATAAAVLASLRPRRGASALGVLASFGIGWTLFVVVQYSQIALFAANKGAIIPAWMAPPRPLAVYEAALRAAALLPSPVPLILLVTVAIGLSARGAIHIASPVPEGRQQLFFLLLVSVLWVAIPPIFLLLSAAGLHNLSLPRYFAPSLLAGAALSCLAMTALTPAIRGGPDDSGNLDMKLIGTASVFLVAVFLLYPIAVAIRDIHKAPHVVFRMDIERDYAFIADARLPRVTNNVHVFFEYNFYRGDRQSLYLLREVRPGAASMQRLDVRIPILNDIEMGRLERFLFVHQPGTVNSYPRFDIQAWAVANRYAVDRVTNAGAITVFELRKRLED